MNGTESLIDICRSHYNTGMYGGAHLCMSRVTFDWMKPETPTPGAPTFATGALGVLAGIPIVVDDDVPAYQWRLLDTKSGTVLREGNIRPVTS